MQGWHCCAALAALLFLAGILYTLLRLPASVLDALPRAWEDITQAVDYVLTLESDHNGTLGPGGFFPSKMGSPSEKKETLVHWCHGAPGAIFLFAQAHHVLRGAGVLYLDAALRCGQAVWEYGPLKKGPGACHGVSGNAYALLCLYKATGDDKWRRRASQFAAFMSSDAFLHGARTPDHPFSLFEGWAAAICLYADLLQPDHAAFPLFET